MSLANNPITATATAAGGGGFVRQPSSAVSIWLPISSSGTIGTARTASSGSRRRRRLDTKVVGAKATGEG
jgi:hypothetical protein